jgi:eukaryotic-like serine/threonine-protein kinase
VTDLAALESLYFAALTRGPADRPAFLDDACRDAPDLRAAVERMLAARPPAAGFLEPAAPRPGPTATYDPPPAEGVGLVVGGRYKLLERIGEGGMGEVYMAAQTEPVRRTVAVKLIKAGMDTGTVLARFEAERQALALMDHPNIARVFDAGTTPGGSPYFVMELVKGVPVTRFCDENHLSIRDRLELFVPVCQAIQHAHSKGVIHRDIKPSNVLVALYDDRPVPKVIDFGVAKATAERLTDKTFYTAYGSIVGTPEYMSPEQAKLNQLDIDTRSDVYALGVLLYELLSGTTPLDKARLGRAALLEILRMVREEDPPRPSTRLSTADGRAGIAANRGTDPARLSQLVRGELDWIVMKALDKDRARRYETAAGLARDVQHYLADEVVEARPPTAAYRFQKLCRRNKAAVLTTGLVVLALLGGLAGTGLGLLEAKRQGRAADVARDDAETKRADAEAARARAESAAAEANAAIRHLETHVFAAARPKNDGGLGPEVSLRAAVIAGLPALRTGFTDQPLVEARLRLTLAATFRHLFDRDLAVEQGERARGLYEAHLGPDHPDTLRSAEELAWCYQFKLDHARRARVLEELLAARRRTRPDDPKTSRAIDDLAMTYSILGRHPEALELRTELVSVYQRTRPPADKDTLQVMEYLAQSYEAVGRPADQIGVLEDIVGRSRAAHGTNHQYTLYHLNAVNVACRKAGDFDRATRAGGEALEIARALYGLADGMPLSHVLSHGEFLRTRGRGREILPVLDEALLVPRAAKANWRRDEHACLAALHELRVAIFRDRNDPAGCRESARMAEANAGRRPEFQYAVGCHHAVAAGLFGRANEAREATAEADQAMIWLTRAVAAGYADRAAVESNKDLDPLRGRPDFRNLIARMAGAPVIGPPPREVK